MTFSEKLDFLMKLTTTTNKELADILFFDSSYISKLRRGYRKTKDIVLIEKISGFFAKKIYLPSQFESLNKFKFWDNLDINMSEEELKILLMESLFLEKEEDVVEKFDEIFEVIKSTSSSLTVKLDSQVKNTKEIINNNSDMELIANINKKRIMSFLDKILLKNDIKNTFFISDTNSMGFENDIEILVKINKVINHIINQKAKVNIILNLSMPIYEMFSIFEKWMPLLFRVNINLWYLQDSEDTVTSRTIFGVEGIGAYTCFGLKDGSNCDSLAIYENFEDYEKLREGFEKKLNRVEPLILKFDLNTPDLHYKFNRKLFEDGYSISVCQYLSMYTMDMEVLEGWALGGNYTRDLDTDRNLQKDFFKYLENNKYVEIVSSSILDYNNYSTKNYWNLKYTEEEYKKHIKNILCILKNYPNYSLVEVKDVQPNTFFHINRNVGGMMIFYDKDKYGAFFESPGIIKLLNKYIDNKYYRNIEYDRKYMINKLEKLVK